MRYVATLTAEYECSRGTALRMMRDEPGDAAREARCPVSSVAAWCDRQLGIVSMEKKRRFR